MDILGSIDAETIRAAVTGFCSGAVMTWGFAQRTIVKDAHAREESMKQRFAEKDKEFEIQVQKIEAIYLQRIAELNEQNKNLIDQVRDLQESRLQIVMSRHHEITDRSSNISGTSPKGY